MRLCAILTQKNRHGTAIITELFDIVDTDGKPTGETVERERAHSEGIAHRTAHLWITRRKNGKVQLLLQKRCMEKDSFPGAYDISSAGHIPAGVDFIPSALRELEEELGISAAANELIYCGYRRIETHEVFHGKPFHDNQFSNVYLLHRDLDESAFTPQPEEIESVKWFDLDYVREGVKNSLFPNCISLEELNMLENRL